MPDMSEPRKRPGAAWWALQIVVGVCIVLPATLRLSAGGADTSSWIDWALLATGAAIAVNALVFVVVNLAAGRPGWIAER